VRPHPAVAIRRDAEISFARLLRELDLATEPASGLRTAPPSLRSNGAVMPVKLRRPKTRTTRVTDEAIEAFRLCEEIVAAGDDELFEDEGGRRHEYLEAHRALVCALGLKPWEASPVDVDEEPCSWSGNLYADSWSRAQELRRELLAAVRER
jgi:hypothetical protein